MTFDLDNATQILIRTPNVIEKLTFGLSDEWLLSNEGEGSWSAYDIVGHLIHGELTDWIPRARIILSNLEDKTFETFDRFAQFESSKGKSFDDLLIEFKSLRNKNIDALQSLIKMPSDYSKKGIHPQLGEVDLKALLSTWVVHDLSHINQISRVMAKQYKNEVGAWKEYLTILK